jgi:hypothetical protein
MNAEVLPLRGKHYGTTVRLSIDNRCYDISIWIPVGPPSDEELADWNLTYEDWKNNVEVDDGWNGKEPIRSMFPCDSHFQSRLEVQIAHYIANAINAYNFENDILASNTNKEINYD